MAHPTHPTENRRGPDRAAEFKLRLSREMLDRLTAAAAANRCSRTTFIIRALDRAAPPLLDLQSQQPQRREEEATVTVSA